MQLEHLLAWIANEPWAIDPTKASEILAFLTDRAAFDKDEGESAKRMRQSDERTVRQQGGSVAVIALHGIMAQRRLPGASTGGGASTEAVGRAIDKAATDSSVKAIILDIDSPGGSVAGTRELAAKVHGARGLKPVIAQVDSIAASAAYWVAAQATEVVSTPGGSVGSIGVIAVHEDISALLEKRGVRQTIISAGKYKAEGNPLGPLSEEAIAHFQGRVDEAYLDFLGGVSIGRGVSIKAVESGYGQGRMLGAAKALGAGMIDRIATLDETLARFVAPQPSTQRRARAARAIARTS